MAFNKILLQLNLSDQDLNKPLTDKIYGDPNSPEVQLILYMYSMEPPFYAAVNSASESMD